MGTFNMSYRTQHELQMLLIVLAALVLLIFLLRLWKKALARKRLTPTVAWLNATYAVLTKINHGNSLYVGGHQRGFWMRVQVRIMLSSAWGIGRKKDAFAMVENLSNGLHSAAFQEDLERTGIPDMTDEEFDQLLAANDPETATWLRFLRDGYTRFGGNACLGWDLSRGIFLLGSYYLASFVKYDEALAQSLALGKKLQSQFDSWDGFLDSYLYGYLYWRENYAGKPTRDYKKRLKIIEKQKSDPNGPYAVDWRTPLSADWK